MTKIYIVQAESGEYSDWRTWIVATYREEALAREHAERASAEIRSRYEVSRESNDNFSINWPPNPWDEISLEGDELEGVQYSIQEIVISETLPA